MTISFRLVHFNFTYFSILTFTPEYCNTNSFLKSIYSPFLYDQNGKCFLLVIYLMVFLHDQNDVKPSRAEEDK